MSSVRSSAIAQVRNIHPLLVVAFFALFALVDCGGGSSYSAPPPPPAGHTAAQLNAILQGHIATVVGHYAGKVYAWDVVNEAFNDNGTLRSTLWYDNPGIAAGPGTAYIEQALRWAHAADPAAKLFYNDYGAEQLNAKSDAIYQMAKDFTTRSVPLNGIGFQMHVGLWFNDPNILNSFATNLKRFTDLGLEVHITEFDVPLPAGDVTNFNKQADLYGQVMQTCLANPKCTAFQTWGFTDAHSWLNSSTQQWPLPFDATYVKKPAYTALSNALGGPATLGANTKGILMGAAAQPDWLNDGTAYGVTLKTEYSQLETENDMKFGPIHPSAGANPTDPAAYNFTRADALLTFAQANNMKVRGHTLVWHNQLPNWLP